jgi:uncharacterized protein involved in exopolysaccharide biosynthesis/nucleoside 2-deoxyribosyltransferase
MVEREPDSERCDDDIEPLERLADGLRFAMRSLRAHPWVFLLTWIAVAAYGAVFVAATPTYFRSTTTIYLSSTGLITAELTGGRHPSDDAIARGLNETVMSSENLLSLVRELKLVETFWQRRPWILRQKDRLLVAVVGPRSKADMERVLVELLRRYVAATFAQPATITFSAEWIDPVTAAALAQGLEQNFRRSRQTDELSAIRRAVVILDAEIRDTDEAIVRSSAALHEALAKSPAAVKDTPPGIAALDAPAVLLARMNLSSTEQKARDLRVRRDKARIDLATAQSEFDNRYRVVEEAEVPFRASRPNRPLLVIIDGIVALGLALLATLLRELRAIKATSQHWSSGAVAIDQVDPSEPALLADVSGQPRVRSETIGERRELGSLVRAFLAYPSTPPTLAETMRNAARKLNDSGQLEVCPWEEMRVAGRLIIDEVMRTIEGSDLVIADLTGLNANVLFEVGYAIAKRKRVWLLVDRSSGNGGARQSRALSTLGYTTYSNSDDVVAALFHERPHRYLDESLYSRFFPGEKSSISSQLLHLKSEHDTEASVQLTKRLRNSSFRTIVDDAPKTHHALNWYGQQISRAEAVLWHLTSQGSLERLALHALVVGLAVGLGKRVLILCHGPVLAPLDYRHLVRHYDTAKEATAHLDSWLAF